MGSIKGVLQGIRIVLGILLTLYLFSKLGFSGMWDLVEVGVRKILEIFLKTRG